MRLGKPRGRGSKPTRRLDLTAIKEVLRDTRCWACMGLITAGDDGLHFENEGEDVLMEVEVMPSEERLTCRLSNMSGGADSGVWVIPKVGTEVCLLIPEGDVEFMPIIVGTLSTGVVPAELEEDMLLVKHATKAVIESSDIRLGGSATEAIIKGDAYKSAQEDFIMAIESAIMALSGALVPPNPGIAATFTAAKTLFQVQLGQSLSTKSKTE